MKASKIYDSTIDILRLISIFAVVLIHTTARTIEISHFDLNNHQFTLLLNQSARFAVPLFFMISGFVLELNYSPSNIFSYYKKRISRILIPYLFWSVIYYFLIYTNHGANFLQAILTGSASYQLYFIPSLLIFYLIFPILSQGLRLVLINAKITTLVLVVLFVIQIIILNQTYKNFGFLLPYPIAVVVFNFFVFLVGMWLSNNREKLIKLLSKLWPLFFIGSISAAYFIFKEGFTNYYKTWNFEAIYTQWRPSVLIYTLFIGGSLYFLFQKIKSKVIMELSKLSFFIFFIHIIILELIWKYVYTNDIGFLIGVLGISTLFAYLVHKIPYLNKLTG